MGQEQPTIDLKALETVTKKVLAYQPKKKGQSQPSKPDTSTASR